MRKGFDERYRAEKDPIVKIRMVAIRMYKTPKADGKRYTLQEVGDALGMSTAWVSKQVKRYDSEGINGLYDRPRSGAPRGIDHAVVKKILSNWKTGKLTSKKIAQEYKEITGQTISRSYSAGHKFLTPFRAQAPHPRLDFARNGSRICVLDYMRASLRASTGTAPRSPGRCTTTRHRPRQWGAGRG